MVDLSYAELKALKKLISLQYDGKDKHITSITAEPFYVEYNGNQILADIEINARFIIGSEEYKGLLNAIKEEKEKENDKERI